MAKTLDLRGYSCPIPLMKTRDVLKEESSIKVIVDEPPAKENIIKFAKSQNYQVVCSEENGEYSISITKV